MATAFRIDSDVINKIEIMWKADALVTSTYISTVYDPICFFNNYITR